MNKEYYDIIKDLYLKNGIQPTNFNLFGIRNSEDQNKDFFNDYIGFFTDIDSDIALYRGTTDPGIYWTLNAEINKGAAHLCVGYHENIWVIDKHKGLYTALCNRWNCNKTKVWRDLNKDTGFDIKIDKIESGRFGINLHRADALHKLNYIGRYSAGCQVIQSANNFDIIIEKAKLSGLKKFSYFLFDKSQVNFYERLGQK